MAGRRVAGPGWHHRLDRGRIRSGARARRDPGRPAGDNTGHHGRLRPRDRLLGGGTHHAHPPGRHRCGIEDHRLFGTTRIGWERIAGFEIGRPGGLWGGFCVQALRRDGTSVDLMSTRAYSRIPSAGHLDELHRISWTLAEAAAQRAPESS
jgi:hypothetical protein